MLEALKRLFGGSEPRRRATGKKRKKKVQPKSTESNPYMAVEIRCFKDEGCEAARALAGQRILVSEAPLLPLPDCDSERCRCRYRRYEDRRQEARRDSDVGITRTMETMSTQDRRKRRGRRKTDFED